MRSLSSRVFRRNFRAARAVVTLALFVACAGSLRPGLIQQIGNGKIDFHAISKTHRSPMQSEAMLRLAPAPGEGFMVVANR